MISLLSLRDIAEALGLDEPEVLAWLESDGVCGFAVGDGRLYYLRHRIRRWVRKKVRSREFLPRKPKLPSRPPQIPLQRLPWVWAEDPPSAQDGDSTAEHDEPDQAD